MIDDKIEDKLTPAARSALDEIIKDYRDQILLSAIRSASDLTGEIKEISIRDILTGIERDYLKITDKKSSKRERSYLMIIFSGFVYTIIGIFLLFFQKFAEFNFPSQVGFILALMGVLLSLTSFFMLRYKKTLFGNALPSIHKSKSDIYSKDLDLVFIKKWREIELTLKDLIALKLGESKANASISFIFDYLVDKNIIDKKNYLILKKLIETRNQILHAGKDFSASELDQAINEADKILEKLRITSQST